MSLGLTFPITLLDRADEVSWTAYVSSWQCAPKARIITDVVPIRPLAQDGSFSPEDITALTTAFEDTLSALGLVNRADAAVTMVAKRLLSLRSVANAIRYGCGIAS